MGQEEKSFDGQCLCGAVRLVVTGDPVGAGYCHRANCRRLGAVGGQAISCGDA
jgi:hypothetical protein